MDRKTRRHRILEHIGRYHLSIRPAIERLFFDGKTCDNVLHALSEDGLVQTRGKGSGLPGGWSYYQLTPKAASLLPVPKGRTIPLSSAALEKNLAILWFCCMMEPTRARLDHRHQEALLGSVRSGEYCVERSKGERLLRMFTIGPQTRTDYFLKAVRADIESALTHDFLADYIQTGLYGCALLVPSEAWKNKAEAALAKAGLPRTVSVEAHIVPGLGTLSQFMK